MVIPLGVLLAAAVVLRTAGSAVGAGPQEVVVLTGEPAVLPCGFNVSAAHADVPSVEWSKEDLDPNVVFLFRDGCESLEMKNPLYEYRSSLASAQLKDGDVSLRLSDVRLSDAGTYRCLCAWKEAPWDVSTVELVVVSAAAPTLSLLPAEGAGVAVLCETGCWWPKPTMAVLDHQGNPIPAEDPETERSPAGCFSLRQGVTLHSATSSVTCRVQDPEFNQTREVKMLVPAACLRCDRWTVGSAVGATVAFCLVAAAVSFLVWKNCNKSGVKQVMFKQESNESTSENQVLLGRPDCVDGDDTVRRLQKENADLRETIRQLQSRSPSRDDVAQDRQPSVSESPHRPDGRPVTCSSPTEGAPPRSKPVVQRQNSLSALSLDGSDPEPPESGRVSRDEPPKAGVQRPNSSSPTGQHRAGASARTVRPKSRDAANGRPPKPGLQRKDSVPSLSLSVQSSSPTPAPAAAGPASFPAVDPAWRLPPRTRSSPALTSLVQLVPLMSRSSGGTTQNRVRRSLSMCSAVPVSTAKAHRHSVSGSTLSDNPYSLLADLSEE